jgi:hypothetical protein
MRISRFALLAGLLLGTPLAFAGAQTPAGEADGLTKVQSKRLDVVMLRPGSDFRIYTKVKIDPVEVAFRKNWLRDYNRSARAGSRISEDEAQRVIAEASATSHEIFERAYAKAGYQVTEESGPDVLRLRTGIVDLAIHAPDKTQGRSRTFANEAGVATLVIEARDSVSGALLGRAFDRKIMGESGSLYRTRVTNRVDFEELLAIWAKASVRGLDELKALSPVQP